VRAAKWRGKEEKKGAPHQAAFWKKKTESLESLFFQGGNGRIAETAGKKRGPFRFGKTQPPGFQVNLGKGRPVSRKREAHG